MAVEYARLSVDGGAIYCGDFQHLLTFQVPPSGLYRSLFATPPKRIRSALSGFGVIIECDDGDYEYSISTGEAHLPGSDWNALFSCELNLTIVSGNVTVCDAVCLSSPSMRDPISADRSHLWTRELGPGTYRSRVCAYLRPSALEVDGCRMVLSEPDFEEWCRLEREGLFDSVTREKNREIRESIEARAVPMIGHIALSLLSEECLSEDDVGDVQLLEIPSAPGASPVIRSRLLRKKQQT